MGTTLVQPIHYILIKVIANDGEPGTGRLLGKR